MGIVISDFAYAHTYNVIQNILRRGVSVLRNTHSGFQIIYGEKSLMVRERPESYSEVWIMIQIG